ncbi:MAG: glycosyltransferase family 4 protein [Paludibacteraceae bacterium]|nr:glycosyltransferase family 4 protein [Paludibacteraceae bacterium]
MRNHPNAIEVGLIYVVPKYLQEGCCLVSPFAKPHFSLPVIEAFTNHKPVIVTDIDGASEVVKHGVNGLIVKKNNPKELANAINFMCNNGKLAQEMGVNGYKDALENIAHQI